jgi:4-diphosphocytidyl-2C-methyl-D-erythritol kinase
MRDGELLTLNETSVIHDAVREAQALRERASNVRMQKNLNVPAFAKVNLQLRVLGKRADGYHELDTVFQTVSLHDTIEFSLNQQPHILLSANDRSLPVDDQNLVIRAARALQNRFGANKGARIRLQKRIPMQAGLGGGSADAAVTLLVLAKLWELNCSRTNWQLSARNWAQTCPSFSMAARRAQRVLGNRLKLSTTSSRGSC